MNEAKLNQEMLKEIIKLVEIKDTYRYNYVNKENHLRLSKVYNQHCSR